MKLTKEEVLAKYGAVPLLFSSYYKYTFTFVGTAEDGAVISAGRGGDHSEIYRDTVKRDSTICLNDEEHYMASVTIGGEEAWSEYDF